MLHHFSTGEMNTVKKVIRSDPEQGHLYFSISAQGKHRGKTEVEERSTGSLLNR
jgi:hypothetical protein